MLTPRRGRRISVWAGLIALVLSTCAMLGAPSAGAAARGDLWTPSRGSVTPSQEGLRRTVNPDDYRAYTLNADAMAHRLALAPLENSAAARRGAALTISVPAPTGELIEFEIAESPVMEAPLAALHPEISTYAGHSVTDGYTASIRLDLTPLGFHASVRDGRATWFVDPAFLEASPATYLSYFGASLPVPERLPDVVLDPATMEPVDEAPEPDDTTVRRIGNGPGDQVVQRVYRLALATDSTYAEYFAPGLNDGSHDTESNALVLAAKATMMNRVNQIYNDDLAIKMLLITNTDALNFNTDDKELAAGYLDVDAGCGVELLAENQVAIDTTILPINYDIGHIALGLNGGGVALLGVVGQNGLKSFGCTGLPNPVGDFMAIDYVAHEMGHQFSGNHTFNGTQKNCSGGNREATTSVEPGSGSSVMAYAGICDSDNLQPHTDPYFSQRTQSEVTAYVTSGNGLDQRGGFIEGVVDNHNPVVTAPADLTIPIRTPFTLRGSATDPDDDDLIYLWEQNDRGASAGTGLISNGKTNGPLFRVFGTFADVSATDTLLYGSPGENIATTSPVRTFPDIDQIIAGSTNVVTGDCPTPVDSDYAATVGLALKNGPVLDCYSEFLPTATYVGDATAGNASPPRLNFRLTARDMSVVGGGTQYDDVVLTIDPTAGPFLVTSQAAPTSYVAGSAQVVTWAVNNTAGLAPNVKISMSTDGGKTFPHILAANTPNDGTQAITVPSSTTTQGWIKVEAIDNVFFDLNDAAITITGAANGLQVTPPANADQSVQYSDGIDDVEFSATTDTVAAVLAATVDAGTPLPEGVTLSARNGTDSDATWTVAGTPTGVPGVFPVTIHVTDGTQTTDVQLTITVTREDAAATYTGETTAELADAGDATAPVDLEASVASTADGTTGDITTATATFTDTTTNTALCTDVAVTGASGIGTAACTADLTPGVHVISVSVGGRYVGTSPDTPVEIVAPATPQTTLTKVPGTWNLSETARFEFTSSVPGSTFVCTLDGISKPCTSPYVATKLSHTTHTFSVAADNNGSTDASPARTITTVPKGYKELKATTDGWKVSKNKNAYLGGFWRTNAKGQVLTYNVENARKLAIIVGTGKNSGDIKVTFRGKVLKTIDLNGPRSRKKLVFLGDFDVPTSGLLKIMTTTTATRSYTRIEGLGVATLP